MEEVAREPTEAIKVGTRGLITAFMGRTRIVAPQVTALKVVVEGEPPTERVNRAEIVEKTDVCEGDKGTNPTPPTKTDKGSGAADRTIGKEVRWHIW